MTGLKPCPFCGHTVNGPYHDDLGTVDDYYIIKCPACDIMAYEDDERTVIETWNQRVKNGMDYDQSIEELTEQFEKKAKALNYDLMAMVLYDPARDNYQINWNDTAPEDMRARACEGVAICLYKLANEDPAIIKEALNMAVFRTKAGLKAYVDQFASAIAKAVEIGQKIGQDALEQTKDIEDPQERLEKATELAVNGTQDVLDTLLEGDTENDTE